MESTQQTEDTGTKATTPGETPKPGKLIITGGKPGYDFKITKLPDNFEDFREFFLLFMDVFNMTFSLTEEKFEKFRKYANPGSIKKNANVF